MTSKFAKVIVLGQENHKKHVESEKDWHLGASFQKNHFLNRAPFYSFERVLFHYRTAKLELFRAVKRHANGFRPERILIAPCGHFDDAPYIHSVWPDARCVGVDIVPDAKAAAQNQTLPVLADLRQLPFAAQCFDAVFSIFFFHHVADEGFDPYVSELVRLLRPEGMLVTLEPSWFHPLFWITWPLKALIGNITGNVEHEHPIFIRSLEAALQKHGLSNLTSFACSFTHNRVPIVLARAINSALIPLACLPLIKHLAWVVGITCFKTACASSRNEPAWWNREVESQLPER